MPKASASSVSREARRHNPLDQEYLATGLLRNKPSKRNSSKKGDDDGEENFVDSKASKKILRIGQELADEDEAAAASTTKPNTAFDLSARFGADADDGEPDFETEEAWGDEEEEVEEVEMDPEDAEAFSRFYQEKQDDSLHKALERQGWAGGGEAGAEQEEEEDQGTDLAAMILRKIAMHEAAQAGGNQGDHMMSAMPEDDYEIPEKVVEVYTKIGMLLSRYKAGKLPKPFKILPSVPHWEDILQITRPDDWTPNACYEATKIFISSTPVVAQNFIQIVLLDKVREEISSTKKLSPHLFNALKKSLYKPAAFFKGFLFPLIGSGTCTLREAHIISGVLVRVSIPVLHSAAALKGLCDIAAQESSAGTEGGGATNIFIKALLEKKYALPYQVIDALVFHFLRFRSPDPASVDPNNAMSGVQSSSSARDAKLPVIWHQSLLAFAERYRNDITEDQREALLDLLLNKGHSQIGPEVRKELLAGRGRGVLVEPAGPDLGGDDTMMMD